MSEEEEYDSDMDVSEDDGNFAEYYNNPEGDMEVVDPSKTDPEHFQFECLDCDQVRQMLDIAVDNLSNNMKITPSRAKILLHAHNWAIAHIVSLCEGAPQSPPSPPAQLSACQRACSVCTVALPGEQFQALECGHLFCKDCWAAYFAVKINQGISTGISCMAQDCTVSAPEDFVLCLVKHPVLRDKYKTFAFRDCVRSHPQLRFCPGANCHVVVCAKEPVAKRVTCTHCHTVFCFRCGIDYHAPTDCATIKRWLTKCADDSETANYISAHTKDFVFPENYCQPLLKDRLSPLSPSLDHPSSSCDLNVSLDAQPCTSSETASELDPTSTSISKLRQVAFNLRNIESSTFRAAKKQLILSLASCPKCNICIEKNGGCNHMQCYGCKHDFCWMCLGDWKAHGSEYYECSRYKENPDIANQSAHAQAREALKKYLHYYERWENHSKSLMLEQETLAKIKTRINTKVMSASGTWIDWQYLLDAATLLVKCRYTLQYTYPYAYYLDPSRKSLFEYQQTRLEAEIENLSWKIERAETTDRADLENQMDIAEKRRTTLLKEFLVI